jgi:hypothetical protein
MYHMYGTYTRTLRKFFRLSLVLPTALIHVAILGRRPQRRPRGTNHHQAVL